MSTPDADRPSVEYESRIVRLGSTTYRLSPIDRGWSVIDGFGGRTIGTARCVVGQITYQGEDAARTEVVMRAWLEHCGAQKREAWVAPPRPAAAARSNAESRSAFDEPIPIGALRDLLGLVRSMWRAAKASKAPPEELARYARVGAELVAAIDLARASTPGTADHRAAWQKAERATARVGDLVSCIDSAQPIIQAAVGAIVDQRARNKR